MNGWDRLVPYGLDGRAERRGIVRWLIVAAALALMWFLSSYLRYYQMLFVTRAGKRVLSSNAWMPPFSQVLGGAMVGFYLMAVAMVILALYHYGLHFQGSRSVDLMRRLPQRWELARRCLAMPLLGLAGTVLAALVMLGAFWLLYDGLTPEACRYAYFQF